MIKASHIVIVSAFLFPAFLIVTYSLSVSSGHVAPFLPYISYTGNFPVESCIFSFASNLSSAIYILIVFLRYSHVSHVIVNSETDTKRMEHCNMGSLVLGVLGAFGLSVMGSFQQKIFKILHVFGVVLCIFCTNIYFIFQTYFSFTLMSPLTNRFVRNLRLVLVLTASLIELTGLFMAIYFLFLSPAKLTHRLDSYTSPDKVNKAGAILEWFILFLYQAFIASYFSEFKKISVGSEEVIIINQRN